MFDSYLTKRAETYVVYNNEKARTPKVCEEYM